MTQDEHALRIFCALLARDPLPAQRFQEINQRFRYLAAISWTAARQFTAAQVDSQAGLEIAWNKAAEPVRKKSPADEAREHSLLANARDDDSPLPAAQTDLIEQLTGVGH